MGKLIVIDGLDGCGKATQADRLYKRLKGMGLNVHKVSFPDYESDSSAAVKMYLNGELGTDPSKLSPYMCSLFYSIDRGIQFCKELNDIYNQPDSILICDRYISANIIHQGSKISNLIDREKYFEWMYDLEVNKVGIPKEDITVVLTLPIEVSQALMTSRYHDDDSKKDIHESDMKYLEKCYHTVSSAVKYLNKIGYNWVHLDCSDHGKGVRTIDDIESDIWNIVKDVLDDTFVTPYEYRTEDCKYLSIEDNTPWHGDVFDHPDYRTTCSIDGEHKEIIEGIHCRKCKRYEAK